MLEVMARNWWMVALRGVAAILFGIGVLFFPGIALNVMIIVWAAYALVDGIFAIIAGIRGRDINKNWWMTVLEGVIGVIAGIGAIIWPGLTALILLYIIAGWAIFTGVLEIIAAIQLRKEIEGEFWLGLSGVISIIFGILLILFPGAGILSVLTIVAAFAILFGILLILLAFRLRGLNNQTGAPRAPQAT